MPWPLTPWKGLVGNRTDMDGVWRRDSPFPSPEFEPWTVHSALNCYTDRAIDNIYVISLNRGKHLGI